MITLIILIATLISAEIKIEIKSLNQLQRTVKYFGSSKDIISTVERLSFNLTDNSIKMAVAKYFGEKPDDVVLKNQTRWGDLHNVYNWKPVTRSLVPYRAKILSFSSTPMLILTQVFNNTSWKDAKFKAPIRQPVNNTISSTWETTCPLTVNDVIKYNFDMTAASYRGRLVATYTSKWGEGVKITERVVAGSETLVEVNLEPKQTMIADLIALKEVIKVQIDYVASLFGLIVVNYENMYKGHHFWSLDINMVMEAAGMKLALPSTEVIVMEYFTDSKVTVRDSVTGELRDSVHLKIFKD